jgi:hypothetical protein
MLNIVRSLYQNDRPRRWLISAGLSVLCLLLLPAISLADPPDPPYAGPEKCAECHSVETEAWENSPHANAIAVLDEAQITACQEDMASEDCNCLNCHTTDFDPEEGVYAHVGVTCEACHGVYVDDHPKNGVMQLDVDSSICQDCHAETHDQWQGSLHAEAGVQCIGCHLSHSQDFRLTDEELCSACHKTQSEDFAHTAHTSDEINCISCHLSKDPTADATGSDAAPSHNFAFAAETCKNCHEQAETRQSLKALDLAVMRAKDTSEEANACPEQLTTRLEEVEQSNKSLRTLSVTGLGMGVGIGGMLGVVAVLIFGYITQTRGRNSDE